MQISSILPPAKFPLIESWLFFGSPVPIISICCVYLLCIVFGIKIMKHREPFNLKYIINIYNLIQITGCFYFAYISHIRFGYSLIRSVWRCESNDMYVDSEADYEEIFEISWFFFLLRLIELFETMFFILRKKNNQVSVLHVYHHLTVLIFLYIGTRYSVEVMDMFMVTLNNDVHIMMYIYYFLSSFESLQKFLNKFKPVITAIQIIQLILVFGQCYAAKLCGRCHLFEIGLAQIAILIILFLNFYYQTYIKAKRSVKLDKIE